MQIKQFLDKCEELKNCKFIMATTKIKDLLKSIVNSQDLYELFNTVSANFDYIASKPKCMVSATDGVINRSYLALPETVGDRLAFIFCLLVEFDRDTINFNEFLRTYFSEDGSYYASFHAFCDTVIGSLEQMVREVFTDELKEEETIQPNMDVSPQINSLPDPKAASMISAIEMMIAEERAYIEQSAIPEDDKGTAYNILEEIFNAVKAGNVNLINALVCGYNYYILYNNSISQGVQALFEAIEEYCQLL
jgi:hypothetical protein